MIMKTNAKTGQTAERRVLRRGITLALFLSLAFCGIPEAAAQKVRVAMPAKSMTFLNFYVGDKFGVYKAEGRKDRVDDGPAGDADLRCEGHGSGPRSQPGKGPGFRRHGRRRQFAGGTAERSGRCGDAFDSFQ